MVMKVNALMMVVIVFTTNQFMDFYNTFFFILFVLSSLFLAIFFLVKFSKPILKYLNILYEGSFVIIFMWILLCPAVFLVVIKNEIWAIKQQKNRHGWFNVLSVGISSTTLWVSTWYFAIVMLINYFN